VGGNAKGALVLTLWKYDVQKITSMEPAFMISTRLGKKPDWKHMIFCIFGRGDILLPRH
jgi:hypothetical protein